MCEGEGQREKNNDNKGKDEILTLNTSQTAILCELEQNVEILSSS